MVNNDDDGLWGLLKINMNMRVYRERHRRDKERNIFWDCVFFWLITIVEKGLEGDLIQKEKFIRERYRKHGWPSCLSKKTWSDMTTLYMSPHVTNLKVKLHESKINRGITFLDEYRVV